MNKNAIKKFAIEARKKLIDSVTDKAGMLGITEKLCSEPITKGADFEVYQTVAGTEVTLNKRQCEQRRRLVSQIESRGFEAVVEEVAYTWFNRICAIRFMEVNDYLPNRVRVLSSEKEGKMEPDLVTQAPDVDLDLTAQEKEEIINWKLSGTSEDTDKMFGKLFLKQCHQLHDILPGLFEADSDYMELLFGISYTNKDDVIYMLVNPESGIPEADFDVSTLDEEGNPTGQVEIIGWLYQYYNTELKDDTFAKLKKNVKITKERIPAATQLFTPDWIVRYMVENSVGRIWIEHLRAVDPSTDEKATAERFGWKYYLPEAEQEEDVNIKLAEIRTTYKDLKSEDITCIDPCMGSGHILIAMFDVLMDIYKSAGYSERDAAFLIVENNIHGLDIDKRAYQLAYFAVMMKGRGYNRRFFSGKQNEDGERVAVKPQVYVIEESNGVNRNHFQFMGLSLNEQERNCARGELNSFLDEMKDCSEYGSCVKIKEHNWELIYSFICDVKMNEQLSFETYGIEQTQEKIGRLLCNGKILSQRYLTVITNPPYMGSGGMNNCLAEYVKCNYINSKSDMSTVFMEVGFNLLLANGIMSMINIPVWMFIKSYTEIRNVIIEQFNIVNLLHLGRGVFGADFGTTAFSIRKSIIQDYKAKYKRLFSTSSSVEDEEKKLEMYFDSKCEFVQKQSSFSRIPEKNFAYWISDNFLCNFDKKKIGDIAIVKEGLKTGDNERFIRLWTEIDVTKSNIFRNYDEQCKWVKHTKGGEFRKWYGNNIEVLNYYCDGRELKAFKKSSLTGKENYLKKCVTWSRITIAKTAFRYMEDGAIPNMAGLALYCDEPIKVIAYLNSIVAKSYLEILNPTINYPPGTIACLPYIEDKEQICNELATECISLSKEDWDSFELSWEFKCHPLVVYRNASNTIEGAYNKWKESAENRFYRLKECEERINEYYISLYRLVGEMESDVIEKDITVRKADLCREIRSLILFAVGCMLGRYSLDIEGLIYAGGDWDSTKYTTFIPDADNIIPITDEEYFSDDIVGRFCEWLKVVYGEDSLEENLDFIAQALGNKGDTSREVIRNYFLNDFIKDHMKIYQKRPIYWLFDSGKANGFKALIYMHRYNPDTVGTVRTEYLHKAQKAIEQAMERATYIGSNGSGSEKAKAAKQITKYTKQLAEIHTYDEAMAHIANQRIDIDLDDGVKVNYEKFQGVEVAQEGKKALKVDLLAKLK